MQQAHELQGIIERQVRELASSVLGEPHRPTLDRPPEADVSVRLISPHQVTRAQLGQG